MTQDTRKDRRVKIVSLNVRYKSATVDEFIENHAHDVSRGGIYIKTGSPFPPGTLLKFEIRLASDQAVITGVGRVVWKRDTTQGTGERPAGMGVKFIKIDDPSKSVIDRLVNSRSDAGRSYESESEAPADGLAAAARTPSNRSAAKPAFGKSTMLGIGAASPAAGAPRVASVRPGASSPPRPSTGGAMFPATASEAEMPPKQEQTVMKQAAELLEEALREAGGSMEDVGTNPLFTGSAPAGKSEKIEVKAASAPPPADAPPSSGPEAARARAMVAGMAPASPRQALSDPPRTTRESPGAKAPERPDSKPASVRPSGRPSIASAPPKSPAKKSSGGGTAVLLAVVVVAVAAGYMFRDQIFGGAAPAPTPSAAATTPPVVPSASAAETPSASEAPAVASGAPSASGSAAAAPSASSTPSAATSASAAPSALSAPSSAPPASAAHSAAAATPAPRPRPRPAAPVAAPTAAATSEDTAPAVTATATEKSTATATPTAAPAPKKPAAKPADDNPY